MKRLVVRIAAAATILTMAATAPASAQLSGTYSGWSSTTGWTSTFGWGGCDLRCIYDRLRPPTWPTWPTSGSTWSPSTGTTVTTTPEPATMALVGSGLVGMGIAARRRRRDETA